jgi:hypothetical protein
LKSNPNVVPERAVESVDPTTAVAPDEVLIVTILL